MGPGGSSPRWTPRSSPITSHPVRSRSPSGPAASALAVFPRLLDAPGFDRLAGIYRKKTGLKLAAVDAKGGWLRGDPQLSNSAESARSFRAQVVAEALRWGEPCVMADEAHRVHWAVPVMENQRLCGGLVVIAGPLQRPRKEGALDRRLLKACACLQDLAVESNLTNASLLAERYQFARRERDRAEALYAVKDRIHDDIRGTYLREEPALLAAIRRGERAEARSILNRILAAIYSIGESRLELLKSLALELVIMMARAAVQAGAASENVLGINYQSVAALAGVTDEEALAPWLCEMLEQLIDSIESHRKNPSPILLTGALEYIEAHFTEPIRREDVAQAAGLSPSHFSHLMRAKTGWSFRELLTRLRVDRACQMLARTDLGLVQIALECGFGDQSYFTRMFRRRTGLTPGAYRRRHRTTEAKP